MIGIEYHTKQQQANIVELREKQRNKVKEPHKMMADIETHEKSPQQFLWKPINQNDS